MRSIELNAFVKLTGHARSGGEAKHLIRSGSVLVNGVVETRNRKQLDNTDSVTIGESSYEVGITLSQLLH